MLWVIHMCLLEANLADLFGRFVGLIWSIFLVERLYWVVCCKACSQEWKPRRHLWWDWTMCLDHINHSRVDCQQN